MYKNLLFIFFSLFCIKICAVEKQKVLEQDAFNAVEEGNLKYLKHLIETEDINVNIQDSRYPEHTLLVHAISNYYGYNNENIILDLVKYLVEKGADLNGFNINTGLYSKMSPLRRAFLSRYYEVAKYLIINGADLYRSGGNQPDHANLGYDYCLCHGGEHTKHESTVKNIIIDHIKKIKDEFNIALFDHYVYKSIDESLELISIQQTLCDYLPKELVSIIYDGYMLDKKNDKYDRYDSKTAKILSRKVVSYLYETNNF